MVRRTPFQRRKATRERRLVRKYGLTSLEYEAMFKKQKGLCLICQQPQLKPLVVDHDHRDGAVRGLLCYSCNTGLGLLGDSPARLFRAFNYLRNHGLRATDEGT